MTGLWERSMRFLGRMRGESRDRGDYEALPDGEGDAEQEDISLTERHRNK